jgi:hypothetical protein
MTEPGQSSHQVFVSWAHGARDWTDEQRSEWEQVVVLFTSLLRRSGINADVDAFHYNEISIDWSRFGPTAIRESDVTLVAVSQPWASRFDGTNDPTEGAGAAAEADELLGLYDRDQAAFRNKVKLIVLPGVTDDCIPNRLRNVQRFEIAELSPKGIEKLIRTLTGQSRYVAPPLGQTPNLPATNQQAFSNDEGRRGRIRQLYEELGALKQTMRRLPEPQPGEGPHLPWWRARQGVLGRMQEIEMELADIEKAQHSRGPGAGRSTELFAACNAVSHELSMTVRVLGLSVGNQSALAVPTSDAMYREFRRELAVGLPPDLLKQVMDAYADMSILADRVQTIESRATARGGSLAPGEVTVHNAFLGDLRAARDALDIFVQKGMP